MVGLSAGEKNFIRGGIEQDLRADGRQRQDFRPILIETGVIPQVNKFSMLVPIHRIPLCIGLYLEYFTQANGSARVRFGATDVIASVKVSLSSMSITVVHYC